MGLDKLKIPTNYQLALLTIPILNPIWNRLSTPSFFLAFSTCVSIVLGLRERALPIFSKDNPLHNKSITSFSRGEIL
jgi:hypothetical protein